MKQLNEDRHPSKLHVRFSEQINQNINLIWKYNQNNQESLSQWYDYIEGIKRWLSNPSIAWDYANRFTKFPNGSRYIRDFNYNIGYTVKTNQYGAYVYVFMINLKPQEFGLKTIKENKSIYTNTMKTNKKVVRLTESDLHKLIEEAVKETLNELDPRTYASAEREALRRTNSVGDKNYERINKFRQAAINAWDKEYGEEWDKDFPTQFGMGQDKGKKSLRYDSDNDTYTPTIQRSIWRPNSHGEDDVYSNIHTVERGNGAKVARQMTKGNGNYIKGKGWQ